MSKKRKAYTAKRKAEIAIAAIKERSTQSQLASDYDVHPTQLKSWKQAALAAIQHLLLSSNVSLIIKPSQLR